MVEINKIKLANSKPLLSVNDFKKPKTKKFPKKLKIGLLVLAGILIFLIILGLTIFLLIKPVISQGKKTYALALESYTFLKNQDLVGAQEKLTETKLQLQETRSLYNRLKWTKFIPFFGAYWSDGERFMIAGQSGIDSGLVLIEAINPYADILGFKGQGSFTGGTAEDRITKMVQTLSKITPQLEEIGANLKIADENLSQVNPSRYPAKIGSIQVKDKIVQVKDLTHDATLALNDARPVLEILPSALGYPDTKRYLALFQNEGELRATGGFMTAYGILRLESGKVRAEGSDDIYTLDKKFNSRLKAPDPIAKYLLNADLKTGIVPYYYLRDMNLSPDFKVSMETFMSNYDKIKDQTKVDGVIAIDTEVLKHILEVIGPIEVPGYGKFTLDPDKRCFDIPQIICELEYLADTALPGINLARKDILGPMMQEIILKAMGTQKSTWPQLFKVVINDIAQKNILFYFKDGKTQEAVEVFGAAGRIKDYDGDYLHVNDSNFGGAKSNLFVKQEVEKEVSFQDGKTINTLTITYTNPTAMSDCNLERKGGLCLNGILRDYIRIYVPKGSKLLEGLGSEEEFKTQEDLDKTYFEGFFTLRGGGGRAKLVLRYELPESIKFDKEYNLLIQKQPGTIGNHYKLNIDGNLQEFDLTADKEIKIKI